MNEINGFIDKSAPVAATLKEKIGLYSLYSLWRRCEIGIPVDIGFQEETSGVVAEQAELRSGGNHVFAIPVFKIFIEVFQPGIVAIGEKPRIEICVDFVEVIAATIQISNPFGITE